MSMKMMERKKLVSVKAALFCELMWSLLVGALCGVCVAAKGLVNLGICCESNTIAPKKQLYLYCVHLEDCETLPGNV